MKRTPGSLKGGGRQGPGGKTLGTMEQHETINSVVDEERKNGDCGPEDAPKTAALTLNGCKSTDNSTGSMIKRAEDDAGVGSTITAAVSKTGAGIPGEGERESAEPGKSKRPFRPPGSIRKARKEKRKAGWDKKKAAIKEKKRAERERRYAKFVMLYEYSTWSTILARYLVFDRSAVSRAPIS